MRIAWFRATAPDTSRPLDDSALLIGELRAAHDIDVITEERAHDFVWQQFLRPWDLCVYELDNTPAHQYVPAYLINYPGVVMLRSTDLPHLRVPLLASRCVVTSSAAAAEVLRARYPDACVRVAPIGIHARATTNRGDDLATFTVVDDRPRDAEVVDRAFRRARDAGTRFKTIEDAGACDVLIAPGWPPGHHTATALLAGLASGKAVVTMEADATAGWPALDPQTWRPRGLAVPEAPIAVTIDPRDEEHSLMLAVRRLSSDAALRKQLGNAGRQWWATHATPAHAAAAWLPIVHEAVSLAPPPRPPDWPGQFRRDGTELAREILSEFGITPPS